MAAPLETPALFWRVEGSLLNLSAMRPVAFFTWNAHSFAERWTRCGGLALLALVRPFFYAADRVFATRLLHTLLRGVSRDRLDLLGEEYFHYVIKPRLKPAGVARLKETMAAHGPVVLAGQALEHVMRPLAEFLGVDSIVANRLEFRDGRATGRLLEPVVRPRGGFAWLLPGSRDGKLTAAELRRDLGLPDGTRAFESALLPARRTVPRPVRPLVLFDSRSRPEPLSVRQALRGKQILLVGGTGFIGKVWLAKLLTACAEVGRIYLLIRRQRGQSGLNRFERLVAESPVFDALHERYGSRLGQFLAERIEVVEGDVTRLGLGLDPEVAARLGRALDLVLNSSGLTDFNPDLRQALATNVDATVHLLDFLRACDHAALLHLSTCYVVGARDGRVPEELEPDYNPTRVPVFDAEREWQALHGLVRQAELRAESPEVTEELRAEVLKRTDGKDLTPVEIENHLRRYRSRWLRNYLTEMPRRRAQELGWPNTYTFTKSLAESLIAQRGAGLPIAVVRPSIVETSVCEPFRGWNEGINTSAPLSHLLGTYFRQLPTNERKCLDLIPVDLVSRGMLLVAAALVERRHQPLYQLATSASNPCDMRRSIELTSLAHRKHYRAQEGLVHWLRSRFDTIPVSKARYQRLSAPAQKALVQIINRSTAPFLRRPPLERIERTLARVEKLIELYEPFILHNEHVFEADNVELLSRALPPDEQEAFGYDALCVDWWDYWINIHVPALRRWVYPLIEGRPLEARPPRPVEMAAARPAESAPRAGEAPLSPDTPWPSS
ncbi:MAG: SDR family oxidoreductase [Acidobacteria bacterium]|nr:SDR family oxidoreductase [Acidobacteriota bacterium]